MSWALKRAQNTDILTSRALQKVPRRAGHISPEPTCTPTPTKAFQVDPKQTDQLDLLKPSGFPRAYFAMRAQMRCNFSSLFVSGCILIPGQAQHPLRQSMRLHTASHEQGAGGCPAPLPIPHAGQEGCASEFSGRSIDHFVHFPFSSVQSLFQQLSLRFGS